MLERQREIRVWSSARREIIRISRSRFASFIFFPTLVALNILSLYQLFCAFKKFMFLSWCFRTTSKWNKQWHIYMIYIHISLPTFLHIKFTSYKCLKNVLASDMWSVVFFWFKFLQVGHNIHKSIQSYSVVQNWCSGLRRDWLLDVACFCLLVTSNWNQ